MLATYPQIQALELELANSQKDFRLACEQEDSRRLQIELLFLKDENAELQATLWEKEDAYDVMCDDFDRSNAWIEELKTSMDNLRLELRLKLKEADRLQTEVSSLQVSSKESTKLLEDKLALDRELKTLRPEIEHLRAQQSSSATLLPEKLALQRELQTLQVELENEKRATRKAAFRDEGQSTKEAKLKLELDTCKADLAKEKLLRQNLEREANKTKAQRGYDTTMNETKLDEYRSKLKSAKEQITGIKAELEEARKANERLTKQATRQPQANRSKRNFNQMDADGTIGTPDGFPPKKSAQLLLGEKSGFGLTPFLKQSKRLAIKSPKDKTDDEEDAVVEAVVVATSSPAKPAAVAVKQTVSARSAAKHKVPSIKAAKSIVDEVPNQLADIEEEEVEVAKPAERSVDAQSSIVEKDQVRANEPAPKKKRRMLGGGQSKTLFDEDDTGNIGTRGVLDDFKFAMPKKVGLAPKGATAFAAKGAAKGGFGAFSPLKRDRKK